MKRFIFFLLITVICSRSMATTWWGFTTVGNTEVGLAFFDIDTVKKSNNEVTILTKYTRSRSANIDGSWYSHIREKYYCGLNKYQMIDYHSYDLSGKILISYNVVSNSTEIPENSYLSAIYQTVCLPTFPTDQSGDLYVLIHGDPLSFTKYLSDKSHQQKP